MQELKTTLKNMLGNNAFNNSFQVNEDFGKLVKALNYLSSQLMMIKNDLTIISEKNDDNSLLKNDLEDQKYYIDKLIISTKEILNGEQK